MLLMYPEPGTAVAMLSNILAPFGEQDAQRIGSLFVAPYALTKAGRKQLEAEVAK